MISTPFDVNQDLNVLEVEEEQFPYRELVGNLIFISIVSRTDIVFAVGVMSIRLFDKHSKIHVKIVKEFQDI